MYENAEQAFGGTECLLSLIGLIYDASDDASLWPLVLDRITEAVNGEPIALFSSPIYPALRTLLPHLQRSLRLYLQSEQAKSEAKDLKSLLDTFDRAVFGLNRNGIVVLSNRQAERIVEHGDGLKLVSGRLIAESLSQNAELQSQIAKAVESGLEPNTIQGTALLLGRTSGFPSLQLTIMPFASNLANNHGHLAALIYVSDPAQQPTPRAALLRQLYGLSPTESRLADMLHQGLEVREAASCLKTTLETTRFHLKRVLSKTGTRRQTELMRLMLSLPAPGVSSAEIAGVPARPSPSHTLLA